MHGSCAGKRHPCAAAHAHPHAATRTTGLPGADLAGVDLSGVNLHGGKLEGANLSGANLSGAVLFHTYLSKANLSKANLQGTDLFDALLMGADLGQVAPLEEILYGPAPGADGKANLVGALRKSMATTGYSDLKEFQRVEVVVAPYQSV